jgi:Cu/Ag efflux pump CusA
VPLDQVAKVGIGDGMMKISREAGRSTAAIGVFIKGRPMRSLVDSSYRQGTA